MRWEGELKRVVTQEFGVGGVRCKRDDERGCLIALLRERRYTGITLGFRPQGVEQFVRSVVFGDIRSSGGTMVRGE